MGSSGSKSCRRASAGRLFCVGEWGGGGILFWVGEGGVRARRISAGRASGDCSAWRMGGWGAAGDWSERAKGEFRLGDLPQGECREIVLRGGRKAGGQEIVLGGRMGSSGSKRHRRASTGRLFCVGEGGDGILFWAGKGEFGIEELPQGERRETVLRGGGMGDGEAAGDWSEREKGEFGLGDLPQGERREIVLRGEAEEGEAAGYCYERENGELGLEELPRGVRRETVLRGARGMGEVAGDCCAREHGGFGLE